MCDSCGTPEPGTMLADLVNIALSSSEFWLGRHEAEAQPKIKNPYIPTIQKGWGKRLLRFTINVVSDGIVGAAAGAGSGGNVVAAGVVGGLTSYAVDDMLFGAKVQLRY